METKYDPEIGEVDSMITELTEEREHFQKYKNNYRQLYIKYSNAVDYKRKLICLSLDDCPIYVPTDYLLDILAYADGEADMQIMAIDGKIQDLNNKKKSLEKHGRL